MQTNTYVSCCNDLRVIVNFQPCLSDVYFCPFSVPVLKYLIIEISQRTSTCHNHLDALSDELICIIEVKSVN